MLNPLQLDASQIASMIEKSSAEKHIDFVIADCKLLAKLPQQSVLTNTAVLGLGDFRETKSKLPLGIATQFISKPVKRSQLLQALSNLTSPCDGLCMSPSRHKKVLVVEDNQLNQTVITHLLKRLNYEHHGIPCCRLEC
jgi:CheY-like chemotaxis protein